MMHFLFKPSISYAQFAALLVLIAIIDSGHLMAGIVFWIVSSGIGGITETFVMERAA